MCGRDRKSANKGMAVNIVVAGMLAVGAGVALSASAAADPPLPLPPPPPAPADPAPPPPPSAAPIGLLPPPGAVQNFLPDGALAPGSGYDFFLGQAPVPQVSDTPPEQQPILLDQRAIQSMLPTNFGLAGQGQQSIYSYTPAPPDAPPAGFIQNAKGAHGLWNYQMGKLDPNQLGDPLPGTAPPPGTNIPAGLGQNLPAEPPPGAPAPPPLPLPPPAG